MIHRDERMVNPAGRLDYDRLLMNILARIF